MRHGLTAGPAIKTECSYYGSHRDQQLLRSGYGHAASEPARQVTGPFWAGSGGGWRDGRPTVTVAVPAPAAGADGKSGAAGKTGIRDASTKAESAGSEEYADPDGHSADGIYPGQSGLAICGPLAWARIARGLMNSGRNHEEQRGAPWGRAGTVHEARHLARSAVWKAGSVAPGRPDHPAGWWLGWVSFPLAPAGPRLA